MSSSELERVTMEKSKRKLVNRILYPLFRLGARAEVHMFFGLPGCGKSSHAAYTVRKCVKRQIPVYSNVPIKGAKQLDIKNIDKYQYEFGSVFVIDEAGLEFCNRDYRTFPRSLMEFFKLHRHRGINIKLYSQGFDDTDKKIRSVTARVYYVYRSGLFGGITKAVRLKRQLVLDERTKEPMLAYTPIHWLNKLFPSFRFRPRKYFKYFNSFTVDDSDKPCVTDSW